MSLNTFQAHPATTPALLKPFQWYVNWVRANPENASSLERLSVTASLIFSDPNNLLSMESFSVLSKVHKFSNEVILQTTYRRVTASEVIIYLLQVIQEVECLFELTLRKYTNHARAWDALVALQTLKCFLNACVHRQLFLVPWMWASIKKSVKHVLLLIMRLPKRLLLNQAQLKHDKVQSNVEKACTNVMGNVVGPNGVRLVIPRVISERRRGLDGGLPAEDTHSRSAAHSDGDEEALSDSNSTEVPFTWIDIFGLIVDAFMLLRPLLLVCVARRCYPKGAASYHIARLTEPADSAEQIANKPKQPDAGSGSQVAKSPSIIETVMAATPSETLFSNWYWWAWFALMDGFMLLAARFIRINRVPVVYIHSTHENSSPDEVVGILNSDSGSNDSLSEEAGIEGAGRSVDATVPRLDMVYDLPVVSRDSLRVQQALRNVAYNFFRDPFFSGKIKYFIYRYFIKGFINAIPLLGSIVTYQASYYLAMRHYSFLYSVGQ